MAVTRGGDFGDGGAGVEYRDAGTRGGHGVAGVEKVPIARGDGGDVVRQW